MSEKYKNLTFSKYCFFVNQEVGLYSVESACVFAVRCDVNQKILIQASDKILDSIQFFF